MLVKKVHDLLACPMLGMEAGVHNQTDGAQHVMLKAKFFAEAFCIERPTFAVSPEFFVLSEGRQPWHLLGDGYLTGKRRSENPSSSLAICFLPSVLFGDPHIQRMFVRRFTVPLN